MLKRFFYIYHNWFTNLNISKNIKKYVHPYSMKHIYQYHFTFKLLYKFRIVVFFFLSKNKCIIHILLKFEFSDNILNIYHFYCLLRSYL